MFTHRPEISAYLVGFALALVSALGLTYLVRERAIRARLFDPQDERKLHTRQIPRVGGVAIFWAFALAIGAIAVRYAINPLGLDKRELTIVLAGGAATHLLGLWDDLRSMRARWKLVGQVIIATAVYAAGLRVTTMSFPGIGILHLGTTLGLMFTVLWFVGITNAFNLIDGIDGLASGAALFALTTMFVVASINGQVNAAIVTLALAGAVLGFLVYNFNPASIFLGDSGSLFLGFMLAGIGLLSSQKGSTVVAVAIPIVSLGLPVLDTSIAIARRFLRGQPIFSADRGHIHHRLLSLGHTPKKVALMLYGACALLALGAMLLVNDSKFVALVLVLVGAGVGLAVQRLRFHEFEELGRVVRRGMRQREVIGRSVRIREASVQLHEMHQLDAMFALLQRTFEVDEFQRVEVRLRPSFMQQASWGASDRRLADDQSVWSWCRSDATSPSWWEIKLPLIDGDARIGSLVLWQDGMASETSLAHMHAIAGQLRSEVQAKLVELWRPVFVDEPVQATEIGVPITIYDDAAGGAIVGTILPSGASERRGIRRSSQRAAGGSSTIQPK